MFKDIDKLVELAKTPIKEVECLEKFYIDQRDYYLRFLYLLVKTRKPMFSIELGVHNAVASAHMAYASDGWVIGIDINGVPLHDKFFSHTPKNYIFINGDSTDPEVVNLVKRITGGNIGLIYQDSSHHYQASKNEWELYSPMCNDLWICDDITPAFHDPLIDPPGKGMVQYFEELPGNKKLYENLHHGNIQGVVLR